MQQINECSILCRKSSFYYWSAVLSLVGCSVLVWLFFSFLLELYRSCLRNCRGVLRSHTTFALRSNNVAMFICHPLTSTFLCLVFFFLQGLIIQPWLAQNSQRSACLLLPKCGTKGMLCAPPRQVLFASREFTGRKHMERVSWCPAVFKFRLTFFSLCWKLHIHIQCSVYHLCLFVPSLLSQSLFKLKIDSSLIIFFFGFQEEGFIIQICFYWLQCVFNQGFFFSFKTCRPGQPQIHCIVGDDLEPKKVHAHIRESKHTCMRVCREYAEAKGGQGHCGSCSATVSLIPLSNDFILTWDQPGSK